MPSRVISSARNNLSRKCAKRGNALWTKVSSAIILDSFTSGWIRSHSHHTLGFSSKK